MAATNTIDTSQFTKCKVTSVLDITPTIRSLKLKVINDNEWKSLMFKAGQWVDFYVPEINKLTGYSITSIPSELEMKNNHTISLAIKKSDDVITNYVHSDKLLNFVNNNIDIHLKVGGNFYFNTNNSKHYILICGGIGITPFASIFKYYCKNCDNSRITLLYSVKNINEFALLNELKEAQTTAKDRSEIVLTVTDSPNNNNVDQKDNNNNNNNDQWNGRVGRIDIDLVKKYRDKHVNDYSVNNCEYLICGPTLMIDEFNEKLQKELKVDKKQIWFEKWW